jgi:hypothetical protein
MIGRKTAILASEFSGCFHPSQESCGIVTENIPRPLPSKFVKQLNIPFDSIIYVDDDVSLNKLKHKRPGIHYLDGTSSLRHVGNV